MRNCKKIFGILTVLMLVLTVLPLNVFALEVGPKVGSYSASASKTTITVGSSASLKITTKKAAGKFTVTSSNPKVAKVTASTTWVDGSTMDTKINIKAVAEGTATVTITPTDVSDENYNFLTNKKSIKITVKKASTDKTTTTENKKTETKKSSDATLKSLTSSVVDIDFSKDKTKYTVYVDKTVTSLGLKAIANNSKANVKVIGDENFVTGTNLVKVVVTAEDGTTKTYEITVIKSKYGSGPLLDLYVKGYEISPEFDPARYKYSIDVVGVTSVEVGYVLTDKDSKVEIVGADDLKVGKNEVKVIVTEENGAVTTYTIEVNVAASQAAVEESNNLIWIIIIIILVLLIVIETVYIVIKKKKEDK